MNFKPGDELILIDRQQIGNATLPINRIYKIKEVSKYNDKIFSLCEYPKDGIVFHAWAFIPLTKLAKALL